MGKFHEKPGSPGDILHFGIKGMKWGVRRERGGSGRSSAQKQQADTLNTLVGGPQDARKVGATQRGESEGGLSDAQKKALMGLGVLGAAAGGYYAYSRFQQNTFMPDGKKPPEWDVSGLKDGPISDTPLGGFSDKYGSQAHLDPDGLTLDTSKGYADFVPKDGFPNDFARDLHNDMASTLEEMRQKYPSVKNLNAELVPMSQVPGMEMQSMQGMIAAVMPMGKGEVRIMYNDMMPDGLDGLAPDAATRALQEAHIPGMFKEKYLGYHEMGHVLAVASGDMPPATKLFDLDIQDIDSFSGAKAYFGTQLKYQASRSYYHKQTFKKHGFSFKELSKLGKYAASQPVESMAELFGHYSHPEMRSRLTPSQIERAERMFNDMGGVKP